MPGFDHNADIKIFPDAGLVTAEIPLADHASSHWISLFRKLAEKRWPGRALAAEARDRPDRTWVIVTIPIPTAGPAPDPAEVLDNVNAVIRETNALEQQSDSDTARTEATIRDWWGRQQR
jgi:hypothetical protein